MYKTKEIFYSNSSDLGEKLIKRDYKRGKINGKIYETYSSDTNETLEGKPANVIVIE